jgi:hypothetical protein
MNFGYTLSDTGYPLYYGYEGNFENYIDGSEPFTSSDIINWRKDFATNKWIYNPQIMVPQSISKLQCVAYLLKINRYNELMAIINADATGVSQILFDAAAVLDRDSNMVNQIAAALGFSSEDTDDFFVEASKILV